MIDFIDQTESLSTMEPGSIERKDSISLLSSMLKSQHGVPEIVNHFSALADFAYNSTTFLRTSHAECFPLMIA